MNNDEAEQFLLKALINYKELLWTDDVSVFVLYFAFVCVLVYIVFFKGVQTNPDKHLDYSFMFTIQVTKVIFLCRKIAKNGG